MEADSERVQYIASQFQNKDTIPAQFIRSAAEQPAATTVRGVVLQIPVIDVGGGGGGDESEIVGLIKAVSEDWGMFQVVNHGIPDDVISRLQNAGREFFELPVEEKELIAKTPSSGIEGYGTRLQQEVDGKKAWVDHLFHKIWPPAAVKYDFWPRNPPGYRQATEDYRERLREASEKLIKWLSIGLGLDEPRLKVAMGGDDTVYLLKINYYPPCPRPDLALGVVAHSDMSALTVLVPSEIQGLQVSRDGEWYDVMYTKNALIVLIGDQMEILSNGKYKAVFHRTTVNKENTRMSWPVFIEPPDEHEIGPIPELVDDKSPPKYKTMKFKDYVYRKLNKIPM
ncbi:Flavonol synthase/flavanone 3-hydroxylase [Striga hermonthica]|uniref:Flavonol synthase/flavanone 3-hydroxylase n=1 Tax=Striga hermonthica TaxID=68872 RepID=A0A9N7NDZ1_STRHE|nr:Flavonol synthase/flavanone 3-hydroxylase [Striga hermonthica]